MAENQKAFIIGGSGELGAEICSTMSDKGFDVAFTYFQDRQKAESLCETLRKSDHTSHVFQLDLADPAGAIRVVRQAAEALGGLDALIVASGIATGFTKDGKPEVPKYFEITVDAYDEMMTVNVRGVFFVCREAARIMKASGGGRIVIVGSIDGVKPVPAPVDYACCKAALWGMTQAMAKELGKHNILVNMVAPGILEGGIAGLLQDGLMNEYLKHCSLKRVGKFREVANAAAFLAGPQNTYLTAQAVVLDGGL